MLAILLVVVAAQRLRRSLGEAFESFCFSRKAPKAKSSPQQSLLLPKAKVEKTHFALAIEKLLPAAS